MMDGQTNGAAAIRQVADAIEHGTEKLEKSTESSRRTYSFGIKSDIVKTVMQGGFAVLVAILFYRQIESGDSRLTQLISSADQRTTEDRKLYAEESREQRKANWESTKLLREGLSDVKKAVEENTVEVKKSGREAAEASLRAAEEIKKIAAKKE